MNKHLYRSHNQLVAGVLAGMAEYFDQDPSLWRIGFALLLIFTGVMPGLLIYVILWVILPINPVIKTKPVDVD